MKRKFLFGFEQKISREGYELENGGDIQQCEAGLSNGVYGSTQNGYFKNSFELSGDTADRINSSISDSSAFK